jgi:hypothetical protein
MHLSQGGEQLGVVAAEAGEKARVGVYLEPVVYEAEDGDYEGANIHVRRPPLLWVLGDYEHHRA